MEKYVGDYVGEVSTDTIGYSVQLGLCALFNFQNFAINQLFFYLLLEKDI